MDKPPLMLLPLETSLRLGKPLFFITDELKDHVSLELEAASLKLSEAEYLNAVIVNLFVVFLLFFGLLFTLNFTVQKNPVVKSIGTALLYTMVIELLVGLSLIRYPTIMSGKKAEQIDKNLVFALKDMLLQVSSGVSLYRAMVGVSKADYGLISQEFKQIVKKVNAGKSMEDALQELAISTKSEYLKRTSWQLVNTIKSGSSLKRVLRSIVDDLTLEQHSKIRDYAHELNLWSLIYMLFAVAVPTIGAVMLVLLSSFAGMGVGPGFFIAFVVICFFIQVVLIGFIKARRPVVNF